MILAHIRFSRLLKTVALSVHNHKLNFNVQYQCQYHFPVFPQLGIRLPKPLICTKSLKVNIMASQPSLFKFFSSKPKDSAADAKNASGEPAVKKSKLDHDEEEKENIQSTPPSSTSPAGKISLSPEQQQRADESKIKAKLTKTSRQTNQLVTVSNFGASWFKALEEEFSKPYFLTLSEFVAKARESGTVYPPPEDVFSFTTACPIDKIKVVIVGQDPYHGPKQAHGLCFSVKKGVRAPPSLVNIYKELENDIEGFTKPDHGDLTSWAEQGVLLLNAVLTVRAHNANSHKDKGWERFTDAVISHLARRRSNLVFVLWGSYAQKKGASVPKDRHCILKGVHPSPLSAHRGFFGSKPFSRANQYLEQHGKTTIDWSSLSSR